MEQSKQPAPAQTPAPAHKPAPAQTPAPAHKPAGAQQKVKLIFAGILLVFGISVAVIFRMNDDNIAKNGIEATAQSTGRYMKTGSGGKRSHTVYKAQYTFTDNKGTKQFVYGEKEYDSETDIKEGKEVTVKYLEAEPHKSLVIAGE